MNEAIFQAVSTTNTHLTPNTNAICSPTGDANNTTNIAFYYNNSIQYWSASVGIANTTATLASDRGNAVVTFEKGLTVTYTALSDGMYQISVSGTIIDSGSLYTLNGTTLGTFRSNSNC